MTWHVYSFCNTVKPVHNSHPWDPQKVAVVQRVAAVQGLVQNSRESQNSGLVGQGIRAGRCWQVAVVQRWLLAQVGLYWQNLLTPLNSYKWHFQILKWMHNPYFCHTHKVEKYCLSCECLILIHLYNSYGNILKHWKDIYVFQFFYKILNRMRRP